MNVDRYLSRTCFSLSPPISLMKIATSIFLLGCPLAAAPDGPAIYQQQCALCHDHSSDTRAPAPGVLRRMTPENILKALESGVKITGCTVHFVDEDVDNGEIILQKEVGVLDGDTVTKLSARILEQEHALYVEAVKKIAGENLAGRGRKIAAR